MPLNEQDQQAVKATTLPVPSPPILRSLDGKWRASVIVIFSLLAVVGFFLPWVPTTFDSGLTIALGRSMYMIKALWQQSFPELFSWLWLVLFSALALLAVGIGWLCGFAPLWARIWSCLLGAASLVTIYLFFHPDGHRLTSELLGYQITYYSLLIAMLCVVLPLRRREKVGYSLSYHLGDDNRSLFTRRSLMGNALGLLGSGVSAYLYGAFLMGDPYKRVFVPRFKLPMNMSNEDRYFANAKSLAWSPDGQLLAASFDGTVVARNPFTGQQRINYVLPPATYIGGFDLLSNPVQGLAWSPDGKYLAALSPYHRGALIWEVSGRFVRETAIPDKKTRSNCSLGWLANGKQIFAGAWDGERSSIYVWDAPTGALLNVYQPEAVGSAGSIDCSPDGAYILIQGASRATFFPNIDKRYLYHVLQILDARSGDSVFAWTTSALLRGAVWSPDSKHLALSYAHSRDEIEQLSPRGNIDRGGGTLQIWDVRAQKMTLTGSSFGLSPDEGIKILTWSPNGKQIAASWGGWDTEVSSGVRVWDATTGKSLRVYKGHQGEVISIAWSPDSKYIASGALPRESGSDMIDKNVLIWEAP